MHNLYKNGCYLDDPQIFLYLILAQFQLDNSFFIYYYCFTYDQQCNPKALLSKWSYGVGVISEEF